MPKASTRLADVFNLPASYFAAIFCILQAGSLYPIFAHRVISINDLQNHLARVWILLHYGDMSAIHKFYRVQWQMLPNLAIDAFGYVFGRVLSLEVTGKVFVATTFILLLSGVVHLHHTLFRKWSLWPLLAAFFLFNRPLLMGYVGFLAGVGLYLNAVALWVRLRNRNVLLRVSCSSVLALVIFFVHLFALGLLGLTIFGMELARVAKRRWDRSDVLRDFMVVGIQFLVPVLVFFFLTPHEHAGVGLHYRGITTRIRAFGAPLCYDAMLDVILIAAIVVMAGVIAIKAKVRVDFGLAAGAALLMIAQFLMPDGFLTAVGADRRIPIALSFLAIAGSDLSQVSLRMQGLFVAVATTVLTVRLWTINEAWSSFDPIYADAQNVLTVIPPGSAVMTAFPPKSFDYSNAPAIAVFFLPVRYAVEHGGFSQPIFASPTQNPVILQADYRELALIWPADVTWQRFGVDETGESDHPLDQHATEILPRFDYVVFVTNGPPIRVQSTSLLSPVKQGRWAQVYRVQK